MPYTPEPEDICINKGKNMPHIGKYNSRTGEILEWNLTVAQMIDRVLEDAATEGTTDVILDTYDLTTSYGRRHARIYTQSIRQQRQTYEKHARVAEMSGRAKPEPPKPKSPKYGNKQAKPTASETTPATEDNQVI